MYMQVYIRTYMYIHTYTHAHIHSHTLSHRVDAQAREAQLFVQKKAIVTEIGMAFQVILAQFEKTRDVEEKKRIGSDMMNVDMGHMVRGRFCSAIARLILDGMKPYRMEGLIIDDIWKITTAFCQEGEWAWQ